MIKKVLLKRVLPLVFGIAVVISLFGISVYADNNTDNNASINTGNNNIEAANINIVPQKNTTNVKFNITNFSTVDFDTAKVDASMIYNGKDMRRIIKTVNASDITIKDNTGTFNIDFVDYGKFTGSVYLMKGDTVVMQIVSQQIGVTADTYNIAPLSGTLPVTAFLLDMWGKNSVRCNGPVFLHLERPQSINWDKMPSAGSGYYGMSSCPYYTDDEVRKAHAWYANLDKFKDYVGSLKDVSPNSTFNLYANDINSGMINRIIYANDIKKYNVKFLSDGDYTYADIRSTYSSNYQENLKIMQNKQQEWKKQETQARSSHEATSYGKTVYSQNNTYAIVDAYDNVTLQVTNKSLIITQNDGDKFGAQVRNDSQVVEISLNSLLKNIEADASATKEFKALYNFSDEYFKKAKEQGKQIMLCIGRRGDVETSLDEYLRFLITYYGTNKYCYYYKGHPASPSSEKKKMQLESIGVDDVDSSVPAELIIFFNKDAKLTGYSSSTFINVDSASVMSMFAMSKKEGTTSTTAAYKDCDYWCSPLSQCSDKKITDLGKPGDFLVEFNDKVIKSQGYDIAIWEPVFAVAKYYKLENGEYKFVKEQKGVPSGDVVSDGTYYIESALSPQFVLDVACASRANGANIQMYQCNGTDAQRWKVQNDSDHFVTLINVASGKALDIANGSDKPGANIQQWEANGSDAQKWKIYNSGDKTKIVSALNHEISIDICGASTANGANVQTYESNGSNAQRFGWSNTLPKVDPVDAGIENGTYKICSTLDSTKVIDIEGPSTENGANVHLWSDLDLPNQSFEIRRETDGYYRVINSMTGKALDVENGFPFNGTNVQQMQYFDNGPQKWQITNNNGRYVFVNVGSGLALDLTFAHVNPGTNIDVYAANGTAAQSWTLVKTKSARDKLDELALANKDAIVDGTYCINSNSNTSFALDVASASSNNGANIQIYTGNKSDAQYWTVSHDSKGYVTFTNKGSRKVLDVAGGNTNAGTNVHQWDANGSYAQKWIVVKDGSSFKIVSALNISIVLDVAGGVMQNCSNVQIYTSNDTQAQRWTFQKEAAVKDINSDKGLDKKNKPTDVLQDKKNTRKDTNS